MRYANITSIPSSYIGAFFSSLVPASAFVSQGSMPWLTNTWSVDIHVLPNWGIEPQFDNADAGTRRPQVRTRRPLRIFSLCCFYVSCFIFIFQCVDYQLLRNMKHSTRMFHIMFQCFISKTLWERFKNTVGAIQKHWGSDQSLPQCFLKWNMKHKMKHTSTMFHISK